MSISVLQIARRQTQRRDHSSTPKKKTQAQKTGLEIHRLMDPYCVTIIPTCTLYENQFLYLLNLHTKMKDLMRDGYVHELKLSLPWVCITHHRPTDEKATSFTVKGVLDGVKREGGCFVVEEYKTHQVPEQLFFRTQSRKQTQLYCLMLRQLLSCLYTECSFLQKHLIWENNCVITNQTKRLLGKHYEHPKTLYENLIHLSGEALIKKRSSNQMWHVKGEVIHISQILTKRAISLGEKSIPCTRDQVRVNYTQMCRSVHRLQPWNL